MRSPLLPNSVVKTVEIIDTNLLGKRWLQEFQIDISEYLPKTKELKLLICTTTGLKFYRPVVAAGLGELYEKLQKNNWYYPTHRWEYDLCMQHIIKFKCQRILEVGCGVGNFLHFCEQHNSASIEGIEINPHAIKTALERGLNASDATLEDLHLKSAYAYDLIFAAQVLEHVTEPGEFIRSALKIIRPKGFLALSIPNGKSFLSQIPDNLLLGPPHHMSWWNVDVFRKIEEAYNIKLVYCAYEPLIEQHLDLYLHARVRHIKSNFLKKIMYNYYYIVFKYLYKKIDSFKYCIKGHTLYVLLQKA